MSISLENSFKGRKNNLDIMRFIAALLVIISHSIPIAYGADYADFISNWTDGGLSIGGIAVGVFFVTGGFLILKSAESKGQVKDYAKARAIRILPPVLVYAVLMVFLVGPILTELSLGDYFGQTGTYKYLLNGILVLQHNLPGVFLNNIYGPVVNGALWTLPIEVLCYALCFFAFKIGITDKKRFKYTIPLAVVLVLAISYAFRGNTFILSVVRPMVLFYIGMVAYVYRGAIKLDWKLCVINLVFFVVAIVMKCDYVAMLIFFPYIIFYLAFGTRKKADWFGKYGEFSYGMYIWGWPVQQVICNVFGGSMDWYVNAILTIPIVLICGVLNYYVVEKRFMKRKH